MSTSWRGGSTRRWRKTRKSILDTSAWCRVRVPTVCTGRATCVHHTLGRDVTGDDPRYLVPSCTECNLHIGDPATHTGCTLCAQPTPRTRW